MARAPQTKFDYLKIIEATEKFYPDVFLGAGYTRATSWKIPELGLSWSKPSDFLRYLFKLTGTNDVKKAYDFLVKSQVSAPEEIKGPKKLDQAIPSKEA